MKVIAATKNIGKLAEIREILKPLNIEVEAPANLPDVDEDGDTFEQNAIKKAAYICHYFKKAAIADDSGLEVDALDGKPGVYSARFAGLSATDEANNQKLLKLMKDVPGKKRTARFKSVVALALPDGRLYTAEGVCEGLITMEPKGNSGFGYDPLFFVPEEDKTFGEMTAERKNSLSHRAKALKELKNLIKNCLFT
jgi:XTP/dITP diphosphohydrolase